MGIKFKINKICRKYLGCASSFLLSSFTSFFFFYRLIGLALFLLEIMRYVPIQLLHFSGVVVGFVFHKLVLNLAVSLYVPKHLVYMTFDHVCSSVSWLDMDGESATFFIWNIYLYSFPISINTVESGSFLLSSVWLSVFYSYCVPDLPSPPPNQFPRVSSLMLHCNRSELLQIGLRGHYCLAFAIGYLVED